jgi:hypothetical protein
VHELKPRISVGRLVRVLVLLPFAVIGAIVSYPTYRLIGVLARRFAKGESALLATIKFLAALLLYPLTYVLLGVLVGVRFGWISGVVTALLLPVFAYVALRVSEDVDDVIGDLRGLLHRRGDLLRKRKAIIEEMIEIGRVALKR